MGHLMLEGVRKTFGGVVALEGLHLELAGGELVTLLGPSGCGKTTALRIVAGFETPDAGRVVVDGQDVTGLPPSKRDMGMVFQAYSLFPNLTALQNVEFGLRVRKLASARRRARAGELLDLVGLSEHAAKYPHQLSGGQQQRVALARALAIRPRILLLDEPLSALDARVRVTLRDEIRRIQRELGTTTLFVTHDQEEALALSDRVGVMSQGRLEQLASPATVYRQPATPFVAEFVGVTNALDGVAEGDAVVIGGCRVPIGRDVPRGSPVRLLVRPEELRIHPDSGAGNGLLPAVVQAHSFLGPITRVLLRTDGGQLVKVDLPSHDADTHPPGSRVRIQVTAVRPVVVAS